MNEERPDQAASRGRRIAFVQSCWHKDLVDQAKQGFAAEIEQLGIAASQVDYFEVTGAFEIPLHAQRLAESGRYDAVVAAVLTPHHFHEHETHRAFFFEHLETKGTEAARACAHTVEALDRLPAPA